MRLLIFLFFVIFYNNSQSAERLFNKADSLFNIPNYEEAISTYNSILENNLESSEIYYNMGLCYFQIKEFQKAKHQFKKSIILNPELKIAEERIIHCNNKLLKQKRPKLLTQIWRNKIRNLWTVTIWFSVTILVQTLLILLIVLKLFYNKKIPNTYLILLLFSSILFYYFVSSLIIHNTNILS
jgi:tetratricopeptide (TPR) repeat protein